ncbi:hypothetical protein KY285_026627 [Solanum tuberosum]|nr:hypothetical protein KY285_026627 [Solanum tuberosum]
MRGRPFFCWHPSGPRLYTAAETESRGLVERSEQVDRTQKPGAGGTSTLASVAEDRVFVGTLAQAVGPSTLKAIRYAPSMLSRKDKCNSFSS